jgi:hypothetical protein
MDTETLYYEYIIKFFDVYFKELKNHYFCKKCKLLKNNLIESTQIKKDCKHIERGYICDLNIYNKNNLFIKHPFIRNNKNMIDLSDIEINVILKEYMCNPVYQSLFYCKICKIIETIHYLNDDIIVKNDCKYLPGCHKCNKIYPACCIDYYKFPLLKEEQEYNRISTTIQTKVNGYYRFPLYVNEDDICIDCYNETNPVNLKPAKK